MKLRTQFIITMSLFGLVLLLIAISLMVTEQQVSRLNAQEETAHRVERGARELSSLSNGYLLYGERQQRARWESHFGSFSEAVARLGFETPEERVLVENIKASQARLKTVFDNIVSTREDPTRTPDAAAEMTFLQVSWSRMEVQNQGTVFDAALLSGKLRTRQDQFKQMNAVLILVLVGLFLAYFVANYALIFQRTLKSLAALQAGTAIIGSGNFDFAIPGRRTDEIGELAHAFNRMTVNLKNVTASKADLEREIAERRRAEDALQESEDRLRRVVHAGRIGLYEWTSNRDTAYWSPEAYELFGHAPDSPAGFERWIASVHPDDRESSTRALAEATEQARTGSAGVSQRVEYRVVHGDGTVLWLEATNAFELSGGDVTIRGAVQDITEHKRAEAALRASEERYRSLFESINEGFALHEIVCDAQGKPVDYRFLEINPAFERLTGLTRQAVIGQLHNALLPNDDPNWVAIYGRVALTGEPVHFENYSPALQQHYEIFAYRPAALQFAVLFVNISERKQAEERIKTLNQTLEYQAEELQQMNVQLEETLAEEQVAREEAQVGRNILESLMQHAPDVLIVADGPDVNIHTISTYGRQVLGRPLDELLGVPGPAHPLRQQLFHADGQTLMAFEETPLVRAIQRGEVVLNCEMLLRRPDGGEWTILSSAGPIRVADGKVTGGVTLWRDITARKRMERSWQEAMRQVERLNRDLEQRAVELEIANKELESFSYSISHDLRTPLAAINGFADLVLQDYGKDLDPDLRRFIELIRNNSTEMTQLVEGLLRFSRLTRQPLRKQPVDLQELARQAVRDLSAQQQGRQVEIVIGDLPPCQADPVLLKQVLLNLLSNALKFTRKCAVARIEICAETTGQGETLYSIRDNGAGFDNEQAERLFGVFQRLHSDAEYEGTGVGLAIVERIIRRHGGRVCAEGQVDRGATFYFTLG